MCFGIMKKGASAMILAVCWKLAPDGVLESILDSLREFV